MKRFAFTEKHGKLQKRMMHRLFAHVQNVHMNPLWMSTQDGKLNPKLTISDPGYIAI